MTLWFNNSTPLTFFTPLWKKWMVKRELEKNSICFFPLFPPPGKNGIKRKENRKTSCVFNYFQFSSFRTKWKRRKKCTNGSFNSFLHPLEKMEKLLIFPIFRFFHPLEKWKYPKKCSIFSVPKKMEDGINTSFFPFFPIFSTPNAENGRKFNWT